MSRKEKKFDAIKMSREIKEAIYRSKHDPDFDPKTFELIKKKWTKLREEDKKKKESNKAS